MLLAALFACAPAHHADEVSLNMLFDDAAAESGVPRDLLVATSYALTRLDARSGEVSSEGGVGLMDLRIDGSTPSIHKAAGLIQASSEDLEHDTTLNVRGGAALLASMAASRAEVTGAELLTYEDWYPVVAQFSGERDPLLAEGFAAQVYTLLSWGLVVEEGDEVLTVQARSFPFLQTRKEMAGSSLIAQFVPASSSNYTNASRTSVNQVVIHTVQGSYSGAISWFQNSAAGGSAHYVVRSGDGEITQTVDEEDIAWHAGHWDTNQNSIGIEHEGYVAEPDKWYTEALYSASARLTRDICDRYGIPVDRSHIIAHSEVPGCSNPAGGGTSCHTDPGSGWDWDKFLGLVNGSGGGSWIPTGSLADGDKTGWFEADVTAKRFGVTKTCSGPVHGVANKGHLYLTGTCHLEHEGRSGDFQVTWSAEESGTDIVGKVVVDAYSDPWEGTIKSDGSISAYLSGAHDLAGDVGVIAYKADLVVDP